MSPKTKKILIGLLSFIVIIVLFSGAFGYFKCEEIFSYDRWGDFHQCHRKLIGYFESMVLNNLWIFIAIRWVFRIFMRPLS